MFIERFPQAIASPHSRARLSEEIKWPTLPDAVWVMFWALRFNARFRTISCTVSRAERAARGILKSSLGTDGRQTAT